MQNFEPRDSAYFPLWVEIERMRFQLLEMSVLVRFHEGRDEQFKENIINRLNNLGIAIHEVEELIKDM